jgi:hypothetical protein
LTNHFFWYHPFSNVYQVHALFDDWEDMTVADWDGTREAKRDTINRVQAVVCLLASHWLMKGLACGEQAKQERQKPKVSSMMCHLLCVTDWELLINAEAAKAGHACSSFNCVERSH